MKWSETNAYFQWYYAAKHCFLLFRHRNISHLHQWLYTVMLCITLINVANYLSCDNQLVLSSNDMAWLSRVFFKHILIFYLIILFKISLICKDNNPCLQNIRALLMHFQVRKVVDAACEADTRWLLNKSLYKHSSSLNGGFLVASLLRSIWSSLTVRLNLSADARRLA